MARAIQIIAAAAFLSATTAAAQTPAKNHEDMACKVKVDKCISLCLMHNPENVCRQYCKPGLVCG